MEPRAAVTSNQHTLNSSYREMLIEHLLVGEIMECLWIRGIVQFEVLKPQVDDSNYDLVLEANGFVRHIQLKSSFDEAATKQVKVSLKLSSKPSACVIWVRFDPETMEIGPFLWFGGPPGAPIPEIAPFRVAKHTRGNAKGVKKRAVQSARHSSSQVRGDSRSRPADHAPIRRVQA
jgi:hypothetical protein